MTALKLLLRMTAYLYLSFHKEPLEDDSVEVALGPPDQETVELHPSITQIKITAFIKNLERHDTS
jgi:hypothetical protein